MSEITVLGIFVADISFSGPKIPSIGETILGKKYNVGPGGKGCNQAIAISRLGGKTNFISKIGKALHFSREMCIFNTGIEFLTKNDLAVLVVRVGFPLQFVLKFSQLFCFFYQF